MFALFNFRFETILLLVKNSMGEIGGIKGLKPEKLMTSINSFFNNNISPSVQKSSFLHLIIFIKLPHSYLAAIDKAAF